MSESLLAPVGAGEVRARLAEVRRRIARAGGDAQTVEVVAVTKGFAAAAVSAALEAGLGAVGENYAQELLAKAAALSPAEVSWHFLGAVQRRKIPHLAPVVACWQSLCRVEEGEAIARHAPGARVFVEVSLAELPGRRGVAIGEAPGLVERLQGLGLQVEGLMAVGPPGGPERARPGFRALSELRRQLGLSQLSAGMTDDLEVAVEEGTTMVRVGRALFGSRPMR